MFLANFLMLGCGGLSADEPVLRIESGQLVGGGLEGRSHQVEASRDLGVWGLVHAVRDEESWSWADPDAPLFGRRYYRLVERVPSTARHSVSPDAFGPSS